MCMCADTGRRERRTPIRPAAAKLAHAHGCHGALGAGQERRADAGGCAQARETISAENGRLCATPFGVDVVGITEVVALTGALVGGAPHGAW